MKINQLTMSAVPRTLACPASLVLPHAPYDTAAAADGTANHAEMEDAAINREWHKMPPRVQELLTAYDPENIYPELGLAYNYVLDEGRVLVGKRPYKGIEPYEIPGTADLVAVNRARRRGLVVDYKRFEEVGHPSVNTQTLGYAAALARTFDLDEVDVAISYLGEGKRYTEDATLDAIDFAAHRVRLMTLDATIAGARVDPNAYIQEGRHCRWCPAFHGCPEQDKLQLSLIGDAGNTEVERRMFLDDDADASAAYEFIQRLGILSKRLRDALYARAAQRPIPLANGKVLGKVTKRGNLELDADTVYKVVRAQYDQEVADLAVKRTASQTGIEDALRGRVKVLSSAKDEVLKAVKQLGGSSRKPKTTIEECDPSAVAAPRAVDGATLAAANQLMQAATP